ncbi:4-hydroxyphenylacetate 3-hydroxylase N-terminal domain-containing protein [Paenibacillus sp. JMULE4]|uniref:4-hydroxyphenylacetate 3-hydroxylase N-terminal domain-containing protein n=1 Tax=Paenibacillus TaxID=44249 RepID=UPI0035C801F2
MERINDGRKVWLGNQAVGNVAHHPAFAATVHNIALLLDKQNEPDTRDQLTYRGDKSRANIAFLLRTPHVPKCSRPSGHAVYPICPADHDNKFPPHAP